MVSEKVWTVDWESKNFEEYANTEITGIEPQSEELQWKPTEFIMVNKGKKKATNKHTFSSTWLPFYCSLFHEALLPNTDFLNKTDFDPRFFCPDGEIECLNVQRKKPVCWACVGNHKVSGAKLYLRLYVSIPQLLSKLRYFIKPELLEKYTVYYQRTNGKASNNSDNVMEGVLLDEIRIEEQKKAFSEWLSRRVKRTTLSGYIRDGNKLVKDVGFIEEYPEIRNIFQINDKSVYESVLRIIRNNSGYIEYNKQHAYNPSACLTNYGKFLESMCSTSNNSEEVPDIDDADADNAEENHEATANIEATANDAKENSVESAEDSYTPSYPLNTILYGPPGTGKTYNTAIYAVAICEEKSLEEVQGWDYDEVLKKYAELKKDKRIAFTTFHQSYGYEEFIEGIRPELDGASNDDSGNVKYSIKDGIFKSFCERAKDETRSYVFVIDEINRGNISKIFGELITLIEPTKRKGAKEAMEVTLPYSQTSFSIPNNVYIIGTMNTADRSLALMDTALRRRFRFEEMLPNPELLNGVVIKHNDQDTGIDIQKLMTTINKRITFLYDREHTIGHAYFLKLKDPSMSTLETLAAIFKNDIIPLLQEYFYDDYRKIRWVLGDNQKIEKYQFIQVVKPNIAGLFGKDDAPSANDLNETYKINARAFDEPEAYWRIYTDKDPQDSDKPQGTPLVDGDTPQLDAPGEPYAGNTDGPEAD